MTGTKMALKYLKKNYIFYVGMIEPIRRGTVSILHSDSNSVFIKELQSGAYMISSDCFNMGKQLLDSIEGQQLFCVYQDDLADYLISKYKFHNHLTCLQAVYTKNYPIKTKASLCIKTLSPEYSDVIYEHYHNNVDYSYIQRRLNCGEIYGGFFDDNLCGFIGTHEEGSIGLLEIFPEFRNRGFGFELEGYLVNILLEKGYIPFSQIALGNEASIRLHKKLHFEISCNTLHWLF